MTWPLPILLLTLLAAAAPLDAQTLRLESRDEPASLAGTWKFHTGDDLRWFILLLPETDLEGAAALAERIRGRVESSGHQHEGHVLRVTMTFGVSECGVDEALEFIDERRDRRVAIERGLHTLRTGALLVAASRRGLLQPEGVRQAFQILQHERYLDSRAVEDILGLLSDVCCGHPKRVDVAVLAGAQREFGDDRSVGLPNALFQRSCGSSKTIAAGSKASGS